MRNKTGIVVLTVIVAALCLYYLSFSLVSRGVQKDAEVYATDAQGNISLAKKQEYLDSVWRTPVFNLLGIKYTYQEVKENELVLGLDLKGGMHVTLEVSPVEIIKAMSGNSKDPNFLKALDRARELQKNSQASFVDLFYQAFREIEPNGRLSRIFSNSANKGRINFDSSDKQVLAVINEEVEGAIDRSFNILRTRIDKFGTSQPNIQRLKGTGRIQIELPGVDDPARVRKLLQGMARLEFWEVWKPEEVSPFFTQLNNHLVAQEAADKALGKKTKTEDDALAAAAAPTTDDVLAQSAADTLKPAGAAADSGNLADQLASNQTATDTAETDSLGANQSATLARLFVPLGQNLGANVRDTAKVNALFNRPDVRSIFPSNMRFLWTVKPIVATDGQEYLELYAVKKGREGKAQVTGDYISDARQDFSQNGQPEISMSMNAAGAKRWQRMTGDNIGRQIAIVLDDYVYSAPVVQGEIPNGNSSISGSFTIEEAQDLANILKAGKMPAPTTIVEEALVGPSLGQEAINQGLLSTLAALGIIIVFMALYYSKGGLVADFSLLINMFFILGILAQMDAPLTLPGIAGIVLTLGMAVDANVLIYERIREEIANGLSMRDAIHKGFDKAFSSIFDANVTTLLVGIILYFFGSGPVKGFAITLIIGIATSFFTAVFLSRVIIEWMARKNADTLSFSTTLSRNMFRNINFNIMKYRKTAYIFSSALIVFGFVAMFLQGGPNLGVDFTGGRSYVVDFAEAVPASDVRENISENFQGAGTEVKTFGASNRLKITTSYLGDDESTEADEKVRTALLEGLQQYKNLNPKIMSASKVGATMADDIQKAALISMLLSLIGIFIYVAFRFGRWQFSLGGVLALFHDALIVIASFSILQLFGVSYEMDQVFVAAILTIIGFSINDTVVIFDRIREYLTDNPRLKVADVMNPALNSTFSRTIITSATVLFVVVVLYVFGGEILRGFSFAMIVGVIFGSYSSLFIAPAIALDTTGSELSEPQPAKPVTAAERVR